MIEIMRLLAAIQVEAGPYLIKLSKLKADLGSIPSIHLARLHCEIPKKAAGLASDLSSALHNLVRMLTQTAESPAQYVKQLSVLTAMQVLAILRCLVPMLMLQKQFAWQSLAWLLLVMLA